MVFVVNRLVFIENHDNAKMFAWVAGLVSKKSSGGNNNQDNAADNDGEANVAEANEAFNELLTS